MQTTIATWLNQTEAAVSRQIGLLQKENLITKEVDPKNRRNHVIILTPEGGTFTHKAMRTLVKEYKPFFAELSSVQQEALNTMLEKVFFAVVCQEQNNGK